MLHIIYHREIQIKTTMRYYYNYQNAQNLEH